jgi:hypothetical protein
MYAMAALLAGPHEIDERGSLAYHCGYSDHDLTRRIPKVHYNVSLTG